MSGHHKYVVMMTFKQFLNEDELLDLRAELYLQQKFGLNKGERKVALAWVDGEIEDIGSSYPEVWQKIYNHYHDTIPYDVAKGEARDFEAHDWVYETLLHDLKDDKIEVHFKPTGGRPRDASDPMPSARHDFNRWGRRDYGYDDY